MRSEYKALGLLLPLRFIFPLSLQHLFHTHPGVASSLGTPDCVCSSPPPAVSFLFLLCLSGLCSPLLSVPPEHLSPLCEWVNLRSVTPSWSPVCPRNVSFTVCTALVTLSDIWVLWRPRVESSFRPHDFSTPPPPRLFGAVLSRAARQLHPPPGNKLDWETNSRSSWQPLDTQVAIVTAAAAILFEGLFCVRPLH